MVNYKKVAAGIYRALKKSQGEERFVGDYYERPRGEIADLNNRSLLIARKGLNKALVTLAVGNPNQMRFGINHNTLAGGRRGDVPEGC